MSDEVREGDWIMTFSGIRFYPLDPRPEEVRIEDVAHALSNLCRYNGHCRNYYSVAEHSILCSQVVPPEHALSALLHDAAEAYVADVPRPLKRMLPDHRAMEQRVWDAVAERFGLPSDLPECVHEADDAVMKAEWEQLMHSPIEHRESGPLAKILIWCDPPTVAEYWFLARYKELEGQRTKP